MIKYVDSGKVRYVKAPFEPYFFIREEDLSKAKELILAEGALVEKGKFISCAGERLVKIKCRLPSGEGSVESLRDKLEALGLRTYESDIPYVKRVMIDMGITAGEIKKRAYVDIEVDAREGFPDPDKAESRLIGIALVGNDGKEMFFSYDDERKMLMELLDNLKGYEVVTGWNWRRFDGPYLANRAKKLGIKWDLFGIHELDAMMNYKKLSIWGNLGSSYTLENVAKVHLGIEHKGARTKIDMEKLWESFVTDKKLLRDYNMEDARLVAKLDALLNLLDPYIALAQRYPILIRESAFMTSIWETILLVELQKQPVRIVLDRKKFHKEIVGADNINLVGGYTTQPKAGVYDWAMSLDYRSLYPSIMITFKLSPELVFLFEGWVKSGLKFKDWVKKVLDLDCNIEDIPPYPVPPDLTFDYRRYIEFVDSLVSLGVVKGPIFANVLARLMEERKRLKNEMMKYPTNSLDFMLRNIKQASIKLLLLSSYGVFGNDTTRFFSPTFFNAITMMGHHIIKYTISLVEKFGYSNIYSDTDSLFLKCKKTRLEAVSEAMDLAKLINEEIKKHIKEVWGIPENQCVIEVEPKFVYEHLLFTKAKKRYRGDAVWGEGKFERIVEMVGFETKRSDAFPLMKQAQEAIQYIVMNSDPALMKENIANYLNSLREALFRGDYDAELIQTKHVQKDLEDYEVEDPHVRVAEQLKEKALLRRGDAVSWVTVAAHNGLVEKAVDPLTREVPKPEWSGYAYYFNRILNMVERMLGETVVEPINIKAGPTKQVKMDEYVQN
ncbi:MAG: DNA polymerase domain-containing protein [Candidatus Caldarchaeum sp.]